MLESPYRPGIGARPVVFAGRDQELDRTSRVLGGVAISGSAAPAPVVFTGPRGVGKTVLLGVTRDQAHKHGFVTAHVVFDPAGGNHRALAWEVAQSANLKPGGRDIGRIRDRLADLSIEVDLGLVKMTSAAPGATQPAPAPADRKHLAGLLVAAAEAAQNAGKIGLAVFIDEIQEAPLDDLRTVMTALQDVIATPRAAVAIFVAGLPHTPEVLVDANSFAERFDYRHLPPLHRDAAFRVLTEPALQLGVRWEPSAVDRVLTEAAGNPFLMQKYGHEIWLTVQPTAGDVLRADDADTGIRAAAEQLAGGMFRGRWRRATPAEQDLMIAMAAVATPSGEVATSDVVAYTGKTTPQWSWLRRSLIDKGLIESGDHGQLRFTMPTFAAFIRDTTTTEWVGPHHTPRELHAPHPSETPTQPALPSQSAPPKQIGPPPV